MHRHHHHHHHGLVGRIIQLSQAREPDRDRHRGSAAARILCLLVLHGHSLRLHRVRAARRGHVRRRDGFGVGHPVHLLALLCAHVRRMELRHNHTALMVPSDTRVHGGFQSACKLRVAQDEEAAAGTGGGAAR